MEGDVLRYRRRLSGPLLDRMDLLVHVARPSAAELAGEPLTRSAEARADVARTRAVQTARFGGTPITCNAQMPPRLLRVHARLDETGEIALARAYDSEHLSARGHHRVLRVARTIADLAGAEAIGVKHLIEALQFRQDTGTLELAA
jgi:magnesium chelatase family protein